MQRHAPFLIALLALPTAAHAQESSGRIYLDWNNNASSPLVHQSHAPDSGLGQVPVHAVGERETATTLTDRQGAYAFTGLTEGTWLITTDAQGPCTSHNCPMRLAEAVAEGHINLVAFGDSIGVVGSSTPYPERLGAHLAGLATTQVTNISVSGSEANQWTPGGAYFEQRLAPLIPDADVIVFTLGGNDLTHYWLDVPWDITAITGFPEAYRQIKADIIRISEEIAARNPDTDIVYVVYPPFANTEIWGEPAGMLWPIVRLGEWLMWADWRQEIGEALPDIILADMLASSPFSETIDPYMYDSLHPNDAGHQWYADVIFEALGGVVIGETPLGLTREIAIANN